MIARILALPGTVILYAANAPLLALLAIAIGVARAAARGAHPRATPGAAARARPRDGSDGPGGDRPPSQLRPLARAPSVPARRDSALCLPACPDSPHRPAVCSSRRSRPSGRCCRRSTTRPTPRALGVTRGLLHPSHEGFQRHFADVLRTTEFLDAQVGEEWYAIERWPPQACGQGAYRESVAERDDEPDTGVQRPPSVDTVERLARDRPAKGTRHPVRRRPEPWVGSRATAPGGLTL
jgi:hypothetical protein